MTTTSPKCIKIACKKHIKLQTNNLTNQTRSKLNLGRDILQPSIFIDFKNMPYDPSIWKTKS
jgi:hypothetical protein